MTRLVLIFIYTPQGHEITPQGNGTQASGLRGLRQYLQYEFLTSTRRKLVLFLYSCALGTLENKRYLSPDTYKGQYRLMTQAPYTQKPDRGICSHHGCFCASRARSRGSPANWFLCLFLYLGIYLKHFFLAFVPNISIWKIA